MEVCHLVIALKQFSLGLTFRSPAIGFLNTIYPAGFTHRAILSKPTVH